MLAICLSIFMLSNRISSITAWKDLEEVGRTLKGEDVETSLVRRLDFERERLWDCKYERVLEKR